MKLIDKDALVAEIERRRDAALTRQKNLESIGQETVLNEMVANKLNRILSFINTLEVKEVDLDNEFNYFLDNVEGVPRMWHSDEQIEWAKDIARHFAEWGKNQAKVEIQAQSMAIAHGCPIEESVSDDLNIEAIKEELDKAVRIYTTGGDFGWGTLYNIACHFSEWQKQQMMKDAVEGWIEADDNRDMNVWARSENFRFLKEHITTPLNVGDKVKLIIIKEE